MKAISLSLLILASGFTVHGKLVTKTVSYEQNGTKLEGYLAYDDSITDKGKVPGILVFPEWWGLNDYVKGRVDPLANLGFVAFAGEIVGNGESDTEVAKPKDLSSQWYAKPLMTERAQAALDQLLK